MFDEKYATLQAGDFAHVAAIVACGVAVILCLAALRRIKRDRFYECLVAAVMLLLEAVFLVWQFSAFGAGVEHLPLNLCTLSLYINALSLLLDRRGAVKYTAFFSIVGAALSIVIPMQGYAFPHFRYLHYYGNHLLIILTSLYLLRELPLIRLKDMLLSELVLITFILAVIHPVNLAFGTEFMFFAVGEGYFGTVFAAKNLCMYLIAMAVHLAFFAVYRAVRLKIIKKGNNG